MSFWQIWNMSFGFLGIQIGFALQNANVSRIFETLGAKVDDIPILWVAAPVTGLIIQPIIGHMSDRTWTPYGKAASLFPYWSPAGINCFMRHYKFSGMAVCSRDTMDNGCFNKYINGTFQSLCG